MNGSVLSLMAMCTSVSQRAAVYPVAWQQVQGVPRVVGWDPVYGRMGTQYMRDGTQYMRECTRDRVIRL